VIAVILLRRVQGPVTELAAGNDRPVALGAVKAHCRVGGEDSESEKDREQIGKPFAIRPVAADPAFTKQATNQRNDNSSHRWFFESTGQSAAAASCGQALEVSSLTWSEYRPSGQPSVFLTGQAVRRAS
jgi:hypothetical protein